MVARVKKLPLGSAGGFAVFKPIEQRFADGDTIKITQNRRAKTGQQRLNNGDVFPIRFAKAVGWTEAQIVHQLGEGVTSSALEANQQ